MPAAASVIQIGIAKERKGVNVRSRTRNASKGSNHVVKSARKVISLDED